MNIDEKIEGWKPAVIKQWGFPNRINKYSIDNKANTFTFSGMTIKVPFILKVGVNKVEPMFDVYLSTPLKKQLASLTMSDNYVWVDKCYEMGRVWAPELALNTGLCVASGNLASKPEIVQASENAVAEVLGHFMGPEGERIESELNARLTSVGPKPHDDKPVIALAGGSAKHLAIRAALNGKWINGLVTDEACAEWLLQ